MPLSCLLGTVWYCNRGVPVGICIQKHVSKPVRTIKMIDVRRAVCGWFCLFAAHDIHQCAHVFCQIWGGLMRLGRHRASVGVYRRLGWLNDLNAIWRSGVTYGTYLYDLYGVVAPVRSLWRSRREATADLCRASPWPRAPATACGWSSWIKDRLPWIQ